MRLLNAPDRLDLLLPWLNGAWGSVRYDEGRPQVVTDWTRVRKALRQFTASFDGSKEAAHVEVALDLLHLQDSGVSDAQLEELGAMLRLLLAQGLTERLLGEVGETWGDVADLAIPTVGLLFSVRSAGRSAPERRNSLDGRRVVSGGVQARRQFHAPGAYVLRVDGPLTSVVAYLVAHLLTAADMVKVKVCDTETCSRLCVSSTTRTGGRPRLHCTTCRPPEENTKRNDKKRQTRKRTTTNPGRKTR